MPKKYLLKNGQRLNIKTLKTPYKSNWPSKHENMFVNLSLLDRMQNQIIYVPENASLVEGYTANDLISFVSTRLSARHIDIADSEAIAQRLFDKLQGQSPESLMPIVESTNP